MNRPHCATCVCEKTEERLRIAVSKAVCGDACVFPNGCTEPVHDRSEIGRAVSILMKVAIKESK